MLKKILLPMALVIAVSAPALAQSDDACPKPATPAALTNVSSMDGATVSKDDLLASIHAFNQFETDSDTYQKCLQTNYDAQLAAAAKSKTKLDASVGATMTANGKANQDQKKQLGDSLNAVIAAYKKAHPA